jgi:hypothetical protein
MFSTSRSPCGHLAAPAQVAKVNDIAGFSAPIPARLDI